MINHQELRDSFKPKKIKLLFVAEAPPENDTFFYSAKSFLYGYTKQVFYEFFKEEMDSSSEFLKFFQNKGCFLDDLSHQPKIFKEIRSNKEFYIKGLKERLELYKPRAVIITPIRIVDFIKTAIDCSNLKNYLNNDLIFPLYFAGYGWKNKYMSGLRSALNYLILKNILT